jgi:hypothetical protein
MAGGGGGGGKRDYARAVGQTASVVRFPKTNIRELTSSIT